MKQSLTLAALIAYHQVNAAAITKQFVPPALVDITGPGSGNDTINYGTLRGKTRWERDGYGPDANLSMITILEIEGTDESDALY